MATCNQLLGWGLACLLTVSEGRSNVATDDIVMLESTGTDAKKNGTMKLEGLIIYTENGKFETDGGQNLSDPKQFQSFIKKIRGKFRIRLVIAETANMKLVHQAVLSLEREKVPYQLAFIK